jgi:hypothetical protein
MSVGDLGYGWDVMLLLCNPNPTPQLSPLQPPPPPSTPANNTRRQTSGKAATAPTKRSPSTGTPSTQNLRTPSNLCSASTAPPKS